MAIMRLNATESAYADSENPNIAYYTQDTLLLKGQSWASPNREKVIFLRFGSYDSIKKKSIKKVTLKFYTIKKQESNASRSEIEFILISDATHFSEKQFTFKNFDDAYKNSDGDYHMFVLYGRVGYEDIIINGYTSFVPSRIENRNEVLRLFNKGIVLRARAAGRTGVISDVNLTISSSRSTNKPCLEFEYEDIIPYAYAQNPKNNIFLNRTEAIQFSWSFSYSNSGILIETIEQQAATIKWREKGSSTEHTINVTGSGRNYTAPANTFGKANYEWCVRVQSNDGIWSNYTSWESFHTINAIPVVTPISPVNVFVNRTIANTFTWSCTISTGTAPTKSELQYSTNGTSWSALATVNGAALSAVIPANKLPSGKLYWRVRAYNLDGVASAWSAAATIVVRGAPDAPVIASVSNSARPIIRWQVQAQEAYQVQLLKGNTIIYDTGEVAGTDKVYVNNDYLEDGSYTARVRIKAASGMWSAWSSMPVAIQTSKPIKPYFSCIPGEGYIDIRVRDAAQYSKIYLLRDGVPIAKIKEVYTDYTAIGEHRYFVRVVNAADSFADSAPQVATCKLSRGILLAPVSDFSDMLPIYMRRGERPRLSGNLQGQGGYTNYAGRRYPLREYAEFLEETYSIALTIRRREDWLRLRELLYKMQAVLYRDFLGNKFYGAIDTLTAEQDFLSVDFELTMTRVDFVEKIEYDPPNITA